MGRGPPASEAGASTALRHARTYARAPRLDSSAGRLLPRALGWINGHLARNPESARPASLRKETLGGAREISRGSALVPEPPASKAHVESVGLNAEIEGDASNRVLREPPVELVPVRPAMLEALRVAGM
jgi:hypothetical protein